MFFLSVYYNTQHQSPPWCSVLYSLLTKTLPLCQTALIIYCLPDSMKQSTKSAIATARQTAMPQVRQGLAGAGEYRRRSWPAGHRVCEDTRRGLGRRIQSRQSASLGLLPPPDSDHIRRYLHPKPHSLETCTTTQIEFRPTHINPMLSSVFISLISNCVSRWTSAGGGRLGMVGAE